MPVLEKALLIELPAADKSKGIPVQFNPASLRLALSNQVEGGNVRGRQSRQFNGKSSTELSFDLHFDTSDESLGGNKPRSVREKTALVEKFVVPAPQSKGSTKRLVPPRVRFLWGDLQIDGVISALTLEFDLFASNGYPLRAKMSVSIKEQDARYEIKQKEEASAAADPPPGKLGTGAPGGSGGGSGNPSDSTGTALDGESAADFAARMGLDPSAWRGIAAGLDDALSLKAGLEIDFDSGLSGSVGLGVTAGIEVGVSGSLEASLGLEVSADASLVVGGSIDAEASAGFALSAAGGLSAAIQTVEGARASSAASATVAAFNAPLATAGAASVAPDPRATSYGFGVPLRTLVTPAASDRSDTLGGRVAVRPGVRTSDPPETREPTVAPWLQIPVDDRSRTAATAVQRTRRPQNRCGCTCNRPRGGCRCR